MFPAQQENRQGWNEQNEPFQRLQPLSPLSGPPRAPGGWRGCVQQHQLWKQSQKTALPLSRDCSDPVCWVPAELHPPDSHT